MLTVDFVRLRRRKDVVELVPLWGVPRDDALACADAVVDVARTHVGESRAALEEALEAIPVEEGTEKLARALARVALDACAFDVTAPTDPVEVRAAVFHAAAEARVRGAFSRDGALRAAADALGTTVDAVEAGLFADLKDAHTVQTFELADGRALLERTAQAELQAVLLRAVNLTFDVEGSAPQVRALLRATKLHQLVFEVEPTERGARLHVEGPDGMFQQSTRYGLKLALLVPALRACPRFRIEARVRIRKDRGLERFIASGTSPARDDVTDATPALPPLVETLLNDLRAALTPWRAAPAHDVLKLPGHGALVPDLALSHAETGELVFVEVLGFWSRDAVWRRVEMVEAGLPYRVVFCASERLRVSEAALDEEAPAALLVFKGVLPAARVLERVERVSRAK